MMHVGRPYAWEKSYPAGMRWDCPIATSTLQELLDGAIADYGDRPALEYRGRRVSYRELGDRAERAAAAFRHIGINRDCAVALYLPNTPWHPIAFFGALRTGARLVHLSPLDAERELIHKLADSGARTIVTVNLAGLDAKALRLAAAGHVDRVIIADDGEWAPLSSPSPLVGEGRGGGLLHWLRLAERSHPARKKRPTSPRKRGEVETAQQLRLDLGGKRKMSQIALDA
jgi:long-chain acyl-CoA synthetase